MPENHLNFHLKDKIYYVCLLKKKLGALILRLTSISLCKMLKIANLHWQQNINLINLELYFVQSFQVI